MRVSLCCAGNFGYRWRNAAIGGAVGECSAAIPTHNEQRGLDDADRGSDESSRLQNDHDTSPALSGSLAIDHTLRCPDNRISQIRSSEITQLYRCPSGGGCTKVSPANLLTTCRCTVSD